MSTFGFLHPHNPDLERFLYASIGEDREGHGETVLSTLARLNLDPWEEAAALAYLDRKAAYSRLGLLLSRFRNVPALGRDHGSVARDLIFRLPQRPPRASRADGSSEEIRKMSPAGAIWTIAAIPLFVVQVMSVFTSGSGE